jgi:hypothetical protein
MGRHNTPPFCVAPCGAYIVCGLIHGFRSFVAPPAVNKMSPRAGLRRPSSPARPSPAWGNPASTPLSHQTIIRLVAERSRSLPPAWRARRHGQVTMRMIGRANPAPTLVILSTCHHPSHPHGNLAAAPRRPMRMEGRADPAPTLVIPSPHVIASSTRKIICF